MIVGPFLSQKGYIRLFVIVIIQRFVVLRCCFTRRFATTSFRATQRCNVETMLQQFETMSQQCFNAVLKIGVANRWLCITTPLISFSTPSLKCEHNFLYFFLAVAGQNLPLNLEIRIE